MVLDNTRSRARSPGEWPAGHDLKKKLVTNPSQTGQATTTKRKFTSSYARLSARRRVCGLPTLWSWTTRGPGRGALGSGPQATTKKEARCTPHQGHDYRKKLVVLLTRAGNSTPPEALSHN